MVVRGEGSRRMLTAVPTPTGNKFKKTSAPLLLNNNIRNISWRGLGVWGGPFATVICVYPCFFRGPRPLDLVEGFVTFVRAARCNFRIPRSEGRRPEAWRGSAAGLFRVRASKILNESYKLSVSSRKKIRAKAHLKNRFNITKLVSARKKAQKGPN